MLVRICWGATAAVSAFSLLTFASDLSRAESAPQQAAAAAMALAWVVMPYVLTRSIEGLFPASMKAPSAARSTRASPADDLGSGQY
jgi:hypothetical protein